MKRRRNELVMKYLICLLVLAILVMSFVMVRVVVIPEIVRRTSSSVQAQASGVDEGYYIETENEIGGFAESPDEDLGAAEKEEADEVLAEADTLAAMYDYDNAISLVQSCGSYDSSEDLQSAVSGYEAQRDSCVEWQPDNVTHIFFHSLIKDASKAFDGDTDAEGYNQYMVTIDEFAAIMQKMYEEGYVMVSMHDMCTVNDDGSVTRKSIYLPSGKIPFVLSQDDLSYYHYMSDDGFAQKLVLDENGEVKCEYIEDDGTISLGDYDLIPWIDTFVKEHPDFSYHGHKGTIALTGYEGVLGYRTDEVYRTREEDRLTEFQKAFLEENPDFDRQKEVDEATDVATVIKENGWEFASHTWGHIDPLASGLDGTKKDTQRWLDNVEPIVGPTDIVIFAFGADIADWQEYEADNEYYAYYKSVGFDIFCNVDSTQYYVQFNGTSMRMGRRNIDGYRMYYNPDLLTDLFEVSDVWDDARPASVASMDGSETAPAQTVSSQTEPEEEIAETSDDGEEVYTDTYEDVYEESYENIYEDSYEDADNGDINEPWVVLG